MMALVSQIGQLERFIGKTVCDKLMHLLESLYHNNRATQRAVLHSQCHISIRSKNPFGGRFPMPMMFLSLSFNGDNFEDDSYIGIHWRQYGVVGDYQMAYDEDHHNFYLYIYDRDTNREQTYTGNQTTYSFDLDKAADFDLLIKLIQYYLVLRHQVRSHS
jgi:hypothetical protein